MFLKKINEIGSLILGNYSRSTDSKTRDSSDYSRFQPFIKSSR